jgi:hypothetical protein
VGIEVQEMLSCSPSFQSANVGDFVNFNARGGSGVYTWLTGGSTSPTVGIGSSFVSGFSTSGTKVVVVTSSDGQSAGCTVNIQSMSSTPTYFPIPAPTPLPISAASPFDPISCSPSFQTASFGQPVTFTANGGNGQFLWGVSSNGSPSSGTGSVFTTVFSKSGFKVVNVLGGDGQSVGCTVNVQNP